MRLRHFILVLGASVLPLARRCATAQVRHLLTDPELNAYVRRIVRRLTGSHCGDVRVYIVQTTPRWPPSSSSGQIMCSLHQRPEPS